MATPVVMPRRGNFVTSGLLSEWHLHPGDEAVAGQPLFTYETDKTEFTEEVPVSGTLLAVFYQAGDDIPCLETIAVIGDPGEDCSAYRKKSDASASSEPKHPIAPSVVDTASAVPPPPVMQTGRTTPPVSPRALASARRLALNPADAQPTGPEGRVIERDIFALCNRLRFSETMLQEPPSAANAPSFVRTSSSYREEPLSKLRRIVAVSMCNSLATTAQLTNHASFDASVLLAFRAHLKALSETDASIPNVSINDLILFAVSRTLKDFPSLNAHCTGETMRYFDHVNLGIAVDTPRGLLVPTLFESGSKHMFALAAEAKKLAAAARQGDIEPDLLHGATFTVSNLGMFGVEGFTPILNPPQTGILGICGIMERVRTTNAGLQGYPAIGLSLTYDHQAVDGAYAARFLAALCRYLEHIDAYVVSDQEVCRNGL